MTAPARLVVLGRIGAAQGLKGEVRVKSFCARPEAIADYGPLSSADGRVFEIAGLRKLGPRDEAMLVVRFKGVDDRTAAEALNGVVLHADRAGLPPPADEDEFYHADLIGLAVDDENGRRIGVVAALHDFGAGDVMEVRRGDGDAVMIPFTKAAAPLVDLRAGRIVVDSVAAGLAPDAEGETPP